MWWRRLLLGAAVVGACSFPDVDIGEAQCKTDETCEAAAPACKVGTCTVDFCEFDPSPECAAPCEDADDCNAGELCMDSECVAGHCDNGAKDGDETATDCGGSCSGCGEGAECDSGGDCDPNIGGCVDGTCGACTTTSQCMTDHYCAGSGVCKPVGQVGDECTADEQCQAEAACTDGHCCLGDCPGPCVSCAVDGKEGRCTQLEEGEIGECEPLGPPLNVPTACDAEGMCVAL